MHYCLIGASLAMILEASRLIKLGHAVTVLSNSNKIGGSWESIDIYDIFGVDNAVHYLLPNEAGIDLMRRLGIKVETITNEKLQVVKVGRLPLFTLYDSRVSGLIRGLSRRSVSDMFRLVTRRSQMIAGGCKGLELWLEDYIYRTGIKIEYQREVESVYVEEGCVSITLADGQRLLFDGVKMGYGVQISKIIIPTGETFCSKEFTTPRPAGHFSIDGLKMNKKLEVIYVNDALMKYMHLFGYKDKGVVVCAFKNKRDIDSVIENHIDTLLQDLRYIGLRITRTSDLKISDFMIPQWPHGVPEYIYKHSLGSIEILCTEDLTKFFELYQERWAILC